MPSMILRYQKPDPYGNEIFIASNKYPDEKESYTVLKKMGNKIEEFDYKTFSPIYYDEDLQFATIRFKHLKSRVLLTERNLYKVEFVVKKSTRDNLSYINCFVEKLKLIKKAPPRVDGEVVDFGF